MDKTEIIALVVIIIVALLYIIWLIRKHQLKDVALELILEAEKSLNNGDEKMNYCIEKIAMLVPLPFSLFITTNTIRKMVQAVFDKVKDLLDYQKPINLNEVEKAISEQIICEPVTNANNEKIGGTE